MRKIVVYKSKTGFTKQYAKWISQRLDIPCLKLEEAIKQVINQEDIVIYGGSIMAHVIMGYDKIAQLNIKNLVVFAVGFSEETAALKTTIKSQNHIETVPFFYMRGGICYEKLNFFLRIMLKKITGQKESIDYSKEEYVNSILSYIQNI